MTAQDVMPLPDDIGVVIEEVASGWEAVAKGVINTQVAADQSEGVPGWIGRDADAYTDSVKKLGEHARALGGGFSPAITALRDWGAVLRAMISTTVPNLWQRYDEATRTYENRMADLDEEVMRAEQVGDGYSLDEIAHRKASLNDALEGARTEIIADYKKSMDGLDAEAQNAAGKIQGVLDSFVDPAKQGSRNKIGASLFDDIPVVDGQAEWEQAQSDAGPASDIINNQFPTEEDVQNFQEQYGEACKNPFFARALAERVDPDTLTRFLAQAQKLRYGSGDSAIDDSLDALCGSLGSAITLSTGGMNADPALAQTNEAFEAARGGLLTDSGDSLDTLASSRLEQWKKAGNQLYDGDGKPINQEGAASDAVLRRHYGYEYLGEMLDSAAKDNPNLALGPQFISGAGSVANDMVAFDHAHRDELVKTNGYGYGEWVGGVPPGGDPRSTDIIESMLRLMDAPEALANESIEKDSPVWERLSQLEAERADAVQGFLASDTTFDVTSAETPSRVPPYNENGPMNMTRYLTGFRSDGHYMGTQDGGDALGRVVAQAATSAPKPQGPMSSEEYEAWIKRSEYPTKIAGNFMLGYQEGLEIENDLVRGEDPYGKAHDKLRGWGGIILAPHVEGITNSLGVTDPQNGDGGPDMSFDTPQRLSQDGYNIRLGSDLRSRIIGANGVFTDFAFDKRIDVNGTPDDITDDRTPSGHPPALTTLTAAANAGYQEDLKNAMNPDHPQPYIPVSERMIDVQKKWAPLMGDMAVAPSDATDQVKEAIEKHNKEIDALVKEGFGTLPYGNLLGEGKDFAKWVLDRAKGIVIPEFSKTLMEEPIEVDVGKESANAEQTLMNSMHDSTYQVISESGYWGDDPERTPDAYFEKNPDAVDFRENGAVMPYNEMTQEQKESFRIYINGEGGLKYLYGHTFEAVGDSLAGATYTRKNARGER